MAYFTQESELILPKVKLSDDDIRGIRWCREVEKAPLQFLAWTYRVSKAQISRICSGKQRKGKKNAGISA